MSNYGQGEEDQARAKLRTLVEQHGQTIFGSPVEETEDMGAADSAFTVRTESSGGWHVTLERISPP